MFRTCHRSIVRGVLTCAAVFLAACVSVRAATTKDNIPAVADRKERALGFVGLSLNLKYASVRNSPRVEIEFVSLATGERTKFLASSEVRLGGETTPVVFALEKGEYALRSAVVRIPSMNYGGTSWEPMEIPLEVQSGAGTFKVEEGEFLHLGHQDISVTHGQVAGEMRASSSQDFRPSLPSDEAWNPMLTALVPTKRSYLRRKASTGLIEKVSADLSAKGKDAPAAQVDDRNDELDRALPNLGFDVRGCARSHLPKFRGEVKCEILVSAEGIFERVQFKNEAWRASEAVRACVQSSFSKRRLSPRSDGRSETWNLTFEVR